MPTRNLRLAQPALRSDPRPVRPYDWHLQDCNCATCEPYRPSVAPRLTAADLARLALAGFAVGHVIVFAIDPTGTAAIAVDLLRWWFL